MLSNAVRSIMKTPVTIFLAIAGTSSAFASDPRFIASLRRLDPETRLEQICDYEAMTRISAADRAKSYVTSAPLHKGDVLTANGGAFRRSGQWFRFSFVCRATPDHLRVTSFDFKPGKLIPQRDWQQYGLWN